MQYKTIVKLLLYTGIRRGELCGLTWDDIDFDKVTTGKIYAHAIKSANEAAANVLQDILNPNYKTNKA